MFTSGDYIDIIHAHRVNRTRNRTQILVFRQVHQQLLQRVRYYVSHFVVHKSVPLPSHLLACVYCHRSTQIKQKKKKSKYAEYVSAPTNAVFFLFDVETTGGKRNWDRIIAFSFLAYDNQGNLLGSFARTINPGSVKIDAYLSKNVHRTPYY